MGQSLLLGSCLVDSAVGKCTHSLVWTCYSQAASSSTVTCVVPGVCRQQAAQGQLGLGHLKFRFGLQKRSQQLVVQEHLCGQSRSVLFPCVIAAAVPGDVCYG